MYFTQKQLEDEKKTLKTPDILSKTPVIINGRIIKWMDSKNMVFTPGTADEREIEDFKKQINDYCKLFGEGAVVFLVHI